MIGTNDWYYTLSTISQTLAAILAMGGTFIIFKLDRIEERIRILRQKAKIIIINFEEKTGDFLNTTDIDISTRLNNHLKTIDLKKDAWGLTNSIKNKLVDIYKVGELIPNMQGSRWISKEEVIDFLHNTAQRFESDIHKKSKTLKQLKGSLGLLTFIIITCILFLPFQSIFGCFDLIILVLISSFAAFSLYKQAILIFSVATE